MKQTLCRMRRARSALFAAGLCALGAGCDDADAPGGEACDFRGDWVIHRAPKYRPTEFQIGGELTDQRLVGPEWLLAFGCCEPSKATIDLEACTLEVLFSESYEDDIECMGQAFLVRAHAPSRPVPGTLLAALVGRSNHEPSCTEVDDRPESTLEIVLVRQPAEPALASEAPR